MCNKFISIGKGLILQMHYYFEGMQISENNLNKYKNLYISMIFHDCFAIDCLYCTIIEPTVMNISCMGNYETEPTRLAK